MNNIPVIKTQVSRSPVFSHPGTGLNAMQLPTAAGNTIAVRSQPSRAIIKRVQKAL